MKASGLLQVYTGTGRGKTSAAFGLGFRAVGCGLKVHMVQFVKSLDYSETKLVRRLNLFPIEQFGRGCFISEIPDQRDVDLAKEGWDRVCKLLQDPKLDLLILDELHIAVWFNLLEKTQIVEDIRSRIAGLEVITTGRRAPKELIEIADLVTDFSEIKHPYQKGITSREGFDC